MNTYRIIPLLTAISILTAACAPSAAPDQPTIQPTARPTTPPTPLPTTQPTPELTFPESVKTALAELLSVDVSTLDVQHVVEAEWPDTCLGLPVEGEVCAAVITPGYFGVVVAKGQFHEFRSDQTGRVVRLIPGAALNARQTLMQQTRVAYDQIKIIGIESVNWPDGCLGIVVEGLMCTQVVTPGYRVVLEIDGDRYVYHTDADGRGVMLAAAPEPDIQNVAIVWEQRDGLCNTAIVGDDKVAFGVCGGALLTGWLIPEMERPDQLAYFVETYAAFEAETPAGKVTFTGRGASVASAAEQRMIAEWARLVQLDAAGDLSQASREMAIAWRREGGIAGFCDILVVHITGEVFASSCQGNEPVDLGRGRLTSDQLAQMYEWIDALQAFSIDQTDPATADAMTIRVLFSGAGTRETSDADQQAIQAFAAQLFAELRQ
jgi:hypothetical protein